LPSALEDQSRPVVVKANKVDGTAANYVKDTYSIALVK
jgi:hypothetical protein